MIKRSDRVFHGLRLLYFDDKSISSFFIFVQYVKMILKYRIKLYLVGRSVAAFRRSCLSFAIKTDFLGGNREPDYGVFSWEAADKTVIEVSMVSVSWIIVSICIPSRAERNWKELHKDRDNFVPSGDGISFLSLLTAFARIGGAFLILLYLKKLLFWIFPDSFPFSA